MSTIRSLRTCAAVLAAFTLSITQVSAQLFQDQMNNGGNWGVNDNGNADFLTTFNYDYSANGIPEAPNSQGGDAATRGLKMEANIVNGAGSFFTVYPTGQNFAGSYQLRFDAWMSFGTSGTTEFLGGGIGYNSLDADLTSGAQAIATGDGDSTNDWRAFYDDTYFPLGDGNAAPYVDFLPSVNGSVAGSPGLQWITWEFNVLEGDVSIFIEKPDLSRLELISATPTESMDGNISLFYADFFTSVGFPTADTFGLIDAVVVNAIPSLPNGDFDNNMLYQCADVDALVQEIVDGTDNSAFDMNGDTVVDEVDLTAWLAQAGAGSGSIPGLTDSGNPVLPGDANLDGTVDGPDFLVWNNNKFQSIAAWCSGDFNADGEVDGPDFLIWNNNKFQTADGVAAVPEPSSWALMAFSFLVCWRFKPRNGTLLCCGFPCRG